MADGLWDDFDQPQSQAAKPAKAKDGLWADFDTGPDFSNVVHHSDTVAAPRSVLGRVKDAASHLLGDKPALGEPQHGLAYRAVDAIDNVLLAPARGVQDADLWGALKRGATSAFVTPLHTASDFVDQTIQAPLRNILQPLGIMPDADPLGAQHVAQQTLGVENEINAERQVAAQKMGPRPTLGDFVDDPGNSLRRLTRRVSEQGIESAPAMAMALATRNPEVAAGILGTTTGAQEYTDLRGQGASRLDAGIAGLGQGAAEVAGEEFGLPFVLGKLGHGSLRHALAAEGSQEFVTQLLQQNIEDQATGHTTSVGQQLSDALDAGLVGAGMGGAGHVAVNAPAVLGAAVNPPPATDAAPSTAIDPALLSAPMTADPAEALRARTADAMQRAGMVPVLGTPESANAPAIESAPPAAALARPDTAPAAQTSPVPADAPPTRTPADPAGQTSFAEQAAAAMRMRAQAEAARSQTAKPEDSDSAQPVAERAGSTPAAGDLTLAPAKPRAVKTDANRKPLDLLRVLAANGGLNREAFQREGVDPKELTRRAGFHYLFRKEGGMRPHDLREFMQQEGYLPPDSEHGVATTSDHDAYDVFDRAFRGGEEIYSADQSQAVAEHRERARQADQAFEAELSADPHWRTLSDADFDASQKDAVKALAERAYDLGAKESDFVDAYFNADNDEHARNALQTLVDRLERDHAARQEPAPGIGAGRVEPGQEARPAAAFQLAQPEPRAEAPREVAPQGGLFAPPTRGEQVRAASQAKDASRNGLGRDLVSPEQGDGELLAGEKPKQADVEQARELHPSEVAPEDRAAFDRQKSDEANRNESRRKAEALSKAQGEADALERGFDTAIAKVLGDQAGRVEYVRDYDGLPEHLRDSVIRRNAERVKAGKKVVTGAVYDPDTQRVFLVTSVVKTPDRAVWNALHELGHDGLRKLLGDKLDPALEITLQNPTVNRVAQALAKDRDIDFSTQSGRLLAAEEALVELSAAVGTGDYDHIQSRYGVEVPEGIRASLTRAIENFVKRLKALLDDLFGRPVFSDEDVRSLLDAAREASKGEGEVGGDLAEQTVFHGSPHRFDRFSLQHIGSGEGAQAFGWGLYFTGKREIADWYRKKLSEGTGEQGAVFVRGERIDDKAPENHAARLLFYNDAREMKSLAKSMLKDARAGEPYAVETAAKAGLSAVDYYTRVADFLRTRKRSEIKVERGQLYEVDIPEDSDLLDNDAKIASQNEKVQEVARAFLRGEGYLRDGENGPRQLASAFREAQQALGGMVKGPDGQSLYEMLAKKLGGEQAASQYLNEHGIPGLKFKAGQLTPNVRGTSTNYVIWNDSAIGAPQPLFNTEPAQTDTPAFRKWFGDSKVVDAHGKPLVVYHGTQTPWTVMRSGAERLASFDENVKGLPPGIADGERRVVERTGAAVWMTDSESVAEGYADGGEIMAAYAALQNPLDLRELETEEIEAILSEAHGKPQKVSDVYGRAKGIAHAVVRDNSRLVQWALEHGHDGLVYPDTDISGRYTHTSYVAFHPGQIKSATANNGNFDASKPSILENTDTADEAFAPHADVDVADMPSRRPGEAQDAYARRVANKGRDELRDINAENAKVKAIGRANFKAMLARMARAGDIADKVFHEYRKVFDAAGKDASLASIHQWETGQTVSDADARHFFGLMDSMFAERIAKVRSVAPDALQSLVENYFPHIWEDTSKAQAWYASNTKKPLDGNKSFLKQRTWGTIQDGMASGLRPVSYNPVDLALLKLQQMDKFIAFNEFKNDLQQRGWVQKIPESGRIPPGYARVDSYAFGNNVIPEAIARDVNNYLSPSLYRFKAWKSLRYVQNVLMSTRLGFSMFHAGFTTTDNLIMHVDVAGRRLLDGDVAGGLSLLAKAPLTTIFSPYEGGVLNKAWTKQQEVDPNTAALLTALEEGGAHRLQTAAQADFNNALPTLLRSIRQKSATGTLKSLLPAVGEASSWLIHQKLVPAQKMAARVMLLKFELDRLAGQLGKKRGDYTGIIEAMHPDALRQVSGKVVTLVDDRLGQMNYDNQFWNKTAREATQALIGAVGWQVGTLRTVTGGLADLRRLWKPEALLAPLDKAGTINDADFGRISGRLSYLVSLALVMGGSAALTQFLLTGEPPDEPKDYFFPKTGRKNPDGSDERLQFPSYWMDHYKLATHPLQTAGHKLHPSISMLMDAINNKDYWGAQIRDEDASWFEQAEQVAKYVAVGFIPYSITGQQKLASNDAGVTRRAANFFGITTAPASVSRSSLAAFIGERSAAKAPQGGMTPRQAAHSKRMHEVEDALRRGEQPDMSDLSEKDQKAAHKSAELPVLALRFKRLSLTDKLRAWQRATPEERVRYTLRDLFPIGKRLDEQVANLPEEDRDAVFQQVMDIRTGRPEGSGN